MAMTAAVDEFAGLFGPPPPGPALPIAYRQGLVVSFDAATLENQVLIGGSILTDLPLLGVGEATLLVPGASVGVLVIGGTGAKTYAIIGRIVRPNTADATAAIGLLNSLVYAATVNTQESRSSTTFGDLATVGPAVTAPVRASGRLLVIVNTQIQWIESNASPQRGGWATIDMTGANTVSTATANDVVLPTANLGLTSPGTTAMAFQGTYTAAGVFTGLNPGLTTVTMKYASQYSGEAVDFGRRTLIVITL
jgi:hypothetical protein